MDPFISSPPFVCKIYLPYEGVGYMIYVLLTIISMLVFIVYHYITKPLFPPGHQYSSFKNKNTILIIDPSNQTFKEYGTGKILGIEHDGKRYYNAELLEQCVNALNLCNVKHKIYAFYIIPNRYKPWQKNQIRKCLVHHTEKRNIFGFGPIQLFVINVEYVKELAYNNQLLIDTIKNT